MRKPLPLVQMEARLREMNAQLTALHEPEMLLEEAFGARLYTGAQRKANTKPISFPLVSLHTPAPVSSHSCTISSDQGPCS